MPGGARRAPGEPCRGRRSAGAPGQRPQARPAWSLALFSPLAWGGGWVVRVLPSSPGAGSSWWGRGTPLWKRRGVLVERAEGWVADGGPGARGDPYPGRGPSEQKGEMLGSPLRPVRMERRAAPARSPEEKRRAARDGDPGEGRAPSSSAPAGSPNSGGSIGAGLTSVPTNDHSASCPPAPPRRRGESAWGWGGEVEIRFRSALINFLFNVTRPHCGRGKHVTQAINCDYGASGRLRVLGTRRTRASRSETGRPDRSRSRLGAAER